MSERESLESPTCADAIDLFGQITTAAQRYLDEPSETEEIHASLQNDIRAYGGHLRARPDVDLDFAELQDIRAERQAPHSAIARIIGNEIVRRMLVCTDDKGLKPDALSTDRYSSAYDVFVHGVSTIYSEASG